MLTVGNACDSWRAAGPTEDRARKESNPLAHIVKLPVPAVAHNVIARVTIASAACTSRDAGSRSARDVLRALRRAAYDSVFFTIVIAVAMRPATSATFCGTMSELLVRASCANASM